MSDGAPANGASSLGGPAPWVEMVGQLVDVIVQRVAAPSGRGAAAGVDADHERVRRAWTRLSGQNRLLAAALGACRCWGTRPRCAECGGAGRAGSFEVDPAAFEIVVAPLVRAQPELFLVHLPRSDAPAASVTNHPHEGGADGSRIRR